MTAFRNACVLLLFVSLGFAGYFGLDIGAAKSKAPGPAVARLRAALDKMPRHFLLDSRIADAYSQRGAYHVRIHKPDEAVADLTEAIRLRPDVAVLFGWRAEAHLQKGEYELAAADVAEAIRLGPEMPWTHNNLAWLLATCPKDGVRDGKRAVVLGTRACELSGWKNPHTLGTLAAAHAESGDFKEAVQWERRAIDLGAADEAFLERARQRLALYESGMPCREEWGPFPGSAWVGL
jgi:serine/threonine-protein kinase